MTYQQFHISILKQGILLLQIEYTHRFCQKQDFIIRLVVIYFFSSLFLGKKAYSFEFKLRLVEEAKRSSNREVGRDHGISETCIRKWRKNEDKLIEAFNQVAGNGKEKFRLSGSGPKRDDLLEQILFDWYTQQISFNVKVTGAMLKAKAHELSNASATTSPAGKKFSDGWLATFKKKHGIVLQKGKDHKEIELMEKILYDWLIHQQLSNVNVSGQMVRAKAEELSKACSPSTEYKFTIGWLDGFKKRYNIRLGDKFSAPTSPQPSTSSDQPDVKPFPSLYLPHKFY